MALMFVAQLFAYIGAIGVSLLAIPQLVKILRSRDSAGVSVPAWICQAMCCGTFLVYGIRIFELPQIVGNVLPVAGALAVAGMAVAARREITAPLVAGFFVATAAYLAFLFAIPPLLVGFVGAGLAVIARWPQVIDSIRNCRNATPTNVSAATWYLLIAGMGSWMIYGVIAMDVPVLVTNVIGVLAAVIILMAEHRNPGNRARQAALATSDPIEAPLAHVSQHQDPSPALHRAR